MSKSNQEPPNQNPCPFQENRERAARERLKSPQEKTDERTEDFKHWLSMQD